MGGAKQKGMKSIHAHISPVVFKKLKVTATILQIDMQDIINNAIREYCDEHEGLIRHFVESEFVQPE